MTLISIETIDMLLAAIPDTSIKIGWSVKKRDTLMHYLIKRRRLQEDFCNYACNGPDTKLVNYITNNSKSNVLLDNLVEVYKASEPGSEERVMIIDTMRMVAAMVLS